MENRLVSVVLCTFNGAPFLAEQVDSILRQDYHPLELVISDDASTDATREILMQYEKNPAVRIFYREQNTGLTRNFAFAAGLAKGDLIAFADQDDNWLEDKIGKLVTAISDKPLVYSDSLLMDEAGKSLGKKLSDLKKMYSGNDSRGYILYSCVWGHGMLITKDLLEKCLPIPGEVHHDSWIAFQALLHGGIRYHDEVLTRYRQHSSSASQTLPAGRARSSKKERWLAFQKKLGWIGLMEQHERPALRPFYKELFRLYSLKEQKSYVFPLVSFMLKHRKELFMFSKKNFASQFVEILKQARGERP